MLGGSGIVTAYSLTTLGPLTLRMGVPCSVVGGALLMALGTTLLPLLRTLDDYSVWPRPLLVVLPDTLSGVGFMHAFTALVAAFNSAVSKHDTQRGAINGLAASCMAAAMAAGPMLASPAFAASIHAFPPTPQREQGPGASGQDSPADSPPRWGALPLDVALRDGVSLVLGGFVLLLLGVASLGAFSWRDLADLQPPPATVDPPASAGREIDEPLDGSVHDSVNARISGRIGGRRAAGGGGSRRERLLPRDQEG